MLKKGQCTQQDDSRGFSILVLNMMEPGTALVDGERSVPKRIGEWKKDIVKFLERIPTSSAADLLQVCSLLTATVLKLIA